MCAVDRGIDVRRTYPKSVGYILHIFVVSLVTTDDGVRRSGGKYTYILIEHQVLGREIANRVDVE